MSDAVEPPRAAGRRLAKRTTIREVDHQLDIGPSIVGRDDDLLTAAERAFHQPQTRVMAVVDGEGRLVGLLPVLRIVEEIVARAAPERLMAEIHDMEAATRFGREIGARVCADLMSPPIALRPDDSVADAFHAMKEHHYSGLPVVDAERRVVGYIDLLELGLRFMASHPGHAPTASQPPPRDPVPPGSLSHPDPPAISD